MSERIPAVVLGGTGYVAGELLRLIAMHPNYQLAAIMSESHSGEPVAGAFPHLGSDRPAALGGGAGRLRTPRGRHLRGLPLSDG